MFQLWLTWRYLSGGGRFLNWTTLLALVGMIVGVACLVLAMSVVSGVQTLLQQAIVDVTGHVLLMKPRDGITDVAELTNRIHSLAPSIQAVTPFVHVEAVLANEGELSGVLVQGVEPETVESVLKIRDKIIKGSFDLSDHDGHPAAIVGKEVARRFQLKPGSVFKLVVPQSSPTDPSRLSPRTLDFYLTGVMDFGKYDFNERTVVTTTKAAQQLANVGVSYSGLRLKLSDPQQAREVSFRIATALGEPYWTRDWTEVSQNFFSAVALEKIVIFVVLMCMVIVACFNISSTLFVSVLRRFNDISVLKTMGASPRFLRRLFMYQGLFIGLFGAIAGILLGMGAGLFISHSTWFQVPAEIYKFDHLPVEFRWLDLTEILVTSFLVCLLSTFAPARRGAKMDPVEGLRYE